MEKPSTLFRVIIVLLFLVNAAISFFSYLAFALAGHAPFVILIALAFWLIVTFGLNGFKYRKYVVHTIIASLLPLLVIAASPLMRVYIANWESRHCTTYEKDIELNLNTICDNGMKIYIKDGQGRLFEGGVSKAKYPYNFFYIH